MTLVAANVSFISFYVLFKCQTKSVMPFLHYHFFLPPKRNFTTSNEWPDGTSKTSLQKILPESWKVEVFFDGLSVFKPSYLWLGGPSEEAGKLHCKTGFKMSILAQRYRHKFSFKVLEIRIDLFTRAAFFYRPSWTSQRWWQCLWHFVVNQPRKSRRGLNYKKKCKGKTSKICLTLKYFLLRWGRTWARGARAYLTQYFFVICSLSKIITRL